MLPNLNISWVNVNRDDPTLWKGNPRIVKVAESEKFISFSHHIYILFGYVITSTLLLSKQFMVIHYYTIKQNWNHYRWYRESSTPWWTGNRQRAYRLVATTRSGCKYNRKGKFLNQSIPMILLKSCLSHKLNHCFRLLKKIIHFLIFSMTLLRKT